MTKEQVDKLLYPRWIVLHEYPDMSEWEVGEILELDYHWHDSNGKKRTISEYPHIFKKLEWWEHRKTIEMPPYVKESEGIIEKAIWEQSEGSDIITLTIEPARWVVSAHNMRFFEPATTEEYNNYHNK